MTMNLVKRVASFGEYTLLEADKKGYIYKKGELIPNLAAAVREVRSLLEGFESNSPNDTTLVRQMIEYINTGMLPGNVSTNDLEENGKMKKVKVKVSGPAYWLDVMAVCPSQEETYNLLTQMLEDGDEEEIRDFLCSGSLGNDFIEADSKQFFNPVDDYNPIIVEVDGKEVNYSFNEYDAFERTDDDKVVSVKEVKNLPGYINLDNTLAIAKRDNDGDAYANEYALNALFALDEKDTIYAIKYLDIPDYEAIYEIEIPESETFDLNKLSFFYDSSERDMWDGEFHLVLAYGAVYDDAYYSDIADYEWAESGNYEACITKNLEGWNSLWHSLDY